MKCLTRYTLCPTFIDLNFSISIGLAKGELLTLECPLNRHSFISQEFKLNHVVDKNLDAECHDKLRRLIARLKVMAKKKDRTRAKEKATNRDAKNPRPRGFEVNPLLP